MLALRVLRDRSSVEVFAQDGRAVLTDRIHPAAASVGVPILDLS
jgi:sucrose-6-phosphate hydrolase SacC (GH32 family)